MSKILDRSSISLLPPVEKTVFVLDHCLNKTVLHVGCTNSPNTTERLDTGCLLHTQILSVANIVHGIDIDEKGLILMRKLGFKGLFYLDAQQLGEPQEGLLENYDAILLLDIIEHVGNPAAILEGARSRLKPGGQIIVSVPNSFYWFGFFLMLMKKDISHPNTWLGTLSRTSKNL